MISSQANGSNGRANWGVLMNTANNGTDATWSDAKIFVQGTSGNVGINTSVPTCALDITGNGRFYGTNLNISISLNYSISVPYVDRCCFYLYFASYTSS